MPREESFPGLRIGMITDDFQIVGILEVDMESLKRTVRYFIATGPRCFKWKMLSLSGPKALLLLQLLMALDTSSVVKTVASSSGFFFASLETFLVSRDELCFPSFEVVNC